MESSTHHRSPTTDRPTARWLPSPPLLVMLLGLGGATALGAADPARQQPIEPPYFAIRGARLVTVSGPVIEEGTVVVGRGLLQAIGRDVEIPPEAWVIEGEGLTVYPGLVDGLSNLGLQGGEARGGGGTGGGGPPSPFGGGPVARGPADRPATTPWENAADLLSLEDKRLESWRKGGFTSAVVAPDDGIFPGQAAFINLAGERARDLVVETPVALRIGLDPPGGFRSFPSSLMGVLSYVEQTFADAQHSGEAWARYRRAPSGRERPTYDRTLEPLRRAIEERRPILLPAQRAVEVRRALRLAKAVGGRPILVGGHGAYALADELAAAGAAVVVDLEWPEKPKDADPDAETPLRVLRFRSRAPSTPAALAAAEVPFAFAAGETGSPKEAVKAVTKAIEAGLSKADAVRALTLGAAEIYGVGDRLGSLEVGKIANLVLTEGDLFDEKAKVKMVFIDGKKHESREPGRPEEPPSVDLTGRWELTVETPQGSRDSTAELEMDDEGNLSGSIRSDRGEGTVIGGWVSGNKLSFTVSMSMGGRSMEATYTGTVEGDEMEGSVSLGPFSAEFTGRRPESPDDDQARD